jgi:hypothetical protein
MTNDITNDADQVLVLRAEDGATYAIPRAALEAFRLSDAQRAELEAHLGAADDDVQGQLYGPAVNTTNTGNIGSFSPTIPGPWTRATIAWEGKHDPTTMRPWQPSTYRPPLH